MPDDKEEVLKGSSGFSEKVLLIQWEVKDQWPRGDDGGS